MNVEDNVFSVLKNTAIAPSVLQYLQVTDEYEEKNLVGGIFTSAHHGWLAFGPRFCVIDLKTGQKTAAWTFGAGLSNFRAAIIDVKELPTPLTENSQQVVISLELEAGGVIAVFHCNGSHMLRCIQMETVATYIEVFDNVPQGPFSCFDGVIAAGTTYGEVLIIDLNRSELLQALKESCRGNDSALRNESNTVGLAVLSIEDIEHIEQQRELTLDSQDHITVTLNQDCYIDDEYIFLTPEGTVRMKSKKSHIRVSCLLYVPQLGSLVIGYNFGAFQIWDLMALNLQFTSLVNVECTPVTHLGFQEPCDDPRAFCYLWVVYSAMDRAEQERPPLAVMHSLTYHGKRMISDTSCLYEGFSSCTVRFELELGSLYKGQGQGQADSAGGRCVCCHTYSISSTLVDGDGEDSLLNLCQLVWETGEEGDCAQYNAALFDLDQWYKDQMPSRCALGDNTFLSVGACGLLGGAAGALDLRVEPGSVAPYAHAARLEEHRHPNSLKYTCVSLTSGEAAWLGALGVQRRLVGALDELGPGVLLEPAPLYRQCVAAGLAPLYHDAYAPPTPAEQRKYLLSVALEARLTRFLKRCARDWATGAHAGAQCTLSTLVDWCWERAHVLKKHATELTAPLFHHTAVMPDRNTCRCLEQCVRQLTALAGLLDAALTSCCSVLAPRALAALEERRRAVGTLALYLHVVQWCLGAGLLPEGAARLPYPGQALLNYYQKRRLKLNRLRQQGAEGARDTDDTDDAAAAPCALLYVDQLIEHELGADTVRELWVRGGGGGGGGGVYPPPSLCALLRLYLLPHIADEHKHSLVLYLLVDYSTVYDEIRYEAIIRRLMQFPTMFGLSTTAIKATQAFWNLDHRDFDFALDQLQCLTGNTLSEWQHNVVLSALLAQNKTQAALQYLHARRPAPLRSLLRDGATGTVGRADADRPDDWRACVQLYLARRLVFEAFDVVRLRVQHVQRLSDKIDILNYFFKSCQASRQLDKVSQMAMSPFEEEAFVRFAEGAGDRDCANILVMYYLLHSRYLEAQNLNNKLRECGRGVGAGAQSGAPRLQGAVSRDSLLEGGDGTDGPGTGAGTAVQHEWDCTRDALVEAVCGGGGGAAIAGRIAGTVAAAAAAAPSHHLPDTPKVVVPRPLSVFVQTSPKDTHNYKSSFIQRTIETASETWVRRAGAARGLRRALAIEEMPFLCTPKLSAKCRSIFHTPDSRDESASPPKRARLELGGTPRTPHTPRTPRAPALSDETAALLEIPDAETTPPYLDLRALRDATPHSILKVRGSSRPGTASPADSQYDELRDELETGSCHTHYSDAAKQLRFAIPGRESGSPGSADEEASPAQAPPPAAITARATPTAIDVDEVDTRTPSPNTNESRRSESPGVRLTESITPKKSYKDRVKARRSTQLCLSSSLSDDGDYSIESIADIPTTRINPRYSGETSFLRERSRDRSVSVDKSPRSQFASVDMSPRSQCASVDRSPRSQFAPVFYDKSPRSQTSGNSPDNRQTPTTKSVDTEFEEDGLLVKRSLSVRTVTQTIEVVSEEVLESLPKSCGVLPEEDDSFSSAGDVSLSVSTPNWPRGRPSIRRHLGDTSSLARSRSSLATPERPDSPRTPRSKYSGGRTPERRSPSVSPGLATIAEREPETAGAEAATPPPAPTATWGRRRRSKTPEVQQGSPPLALQLPPIAEADDAVSPPKRRSRSKTPERVGVARLPSASETDVHPSASSPVRRSLRKSRSKTPEKMELTKAAPKLETVSEAQEESKPRRSLRSRSRTPELEPAQQPSSQRGRSKTPERIRPASPKLLSTTKSRKSLSRIVLENNTFAQVAKPQTVPPKTDDIKAQEQKSESTPRKAPKIDMSCTFSPIVDKSVLNDTSSLHLQSDIESSKEINFSVNEHRTLTPFADTFVDKSVLVSCQSSDADYSGKHTPEPIDIDNTDKSTKESPSTVKSYSDITPSDLKQTSVLKDQSSIEGQPDTEIPNELVNCGSTIPEMKETEVPKTHLVESDREKLISSRQSELREEKARSAIQQRWRIVELECEISEMERNMVSSDESDESDVEDPIGDHSDGESEESNNSASGDRQVEADSEEIDEENDSKERDESSNDGGVDQNVICIDDSDDEKDEPKISPDNESNDTSSTSEEMCLRIDIDEEDLNEINCEGKLEKVEKNTDKGVKSDQDAGYDGSKINETDTDNVNATNFSFMTDDNSVLTSDCSDAHLSHIDKSGAQTEQMPKETDAKQTSKDKLNFYSEKDNDSIDGTKSRSNLKESELVNTSEATKKALQVEIEIEREGESNAVVEDTPKRASKSRKTSKTPPRNQKSSSKANESLIEQTVSTQPSKVAPNIAQAETQTPEQIRRAKRTKVLKTPEREIPVKKSKEEINEELIPKTSPTLKEPVNETKEEIVVTPKRLTRSASKEQPVRRSSRSKSKDDESIASSESVRSRASKGKDDADSAKSSAPVKTRRRSILTKPDLTVIPEVDGTLDKDQIINEYAVGRRLTRHQKSMLEEVLTPMPPPRRAARRNSNASNSSVAGSDLSDDEPTGTAAKILTRSKSVTASDNIHELEMSPAKKPMRRVARSASEIVEPKISTTKLRRLSTDVGADDPSGGRARTARSSFKRALHSLASPSTSTAPATAPGRRTLDTKEADVEGAESPNQSKDGARRRGRRAPSTEESVSSPARRSRRTPSAT